MKLQLFAIALWGLCCCGSGCAMKPSAATADKPGEMPWVVAEAAMPAGFPDPSPVGQIVVKTYPAHRVAVARGSGMQDEQFKSLFDHIKKNEIAMTSPVELKLTGDSADPRRPDAMAFMYADAKLGHTGTDGGVEVIDLPSTTVVSIAVRGEYNQENYSKAAAQLREWLVSHRGEYTADGTPRLLGYNSPMVPWLWKYSEVQIPVRPVTAAPAMP